MNPAFQNILNALTQVLATSSATGAGGGINSPLANSLLGHILHIGSTQAGLDFKAKTMTTTWYDGNQSTAIGLMANGWTIIPG